MTTNIEFSHDTSGECADIAMYMFMRMGKYY